MRLLSISRFASLAQVPVTTLRHWADLAVLQPARVDPGSGYRYYSSGQLRVATDIRLMRALDIPLEDIARILSRDAGEAVKAIDDQAQSLAVHASAQQRVASFLRDRFTASQENGMLEVTVITRAEQPVLARRRTIGIDELSPWLTHTFAELFALAHEHELEVMGPPLTIFHSPVNDDAVGEVEACLPVSGNGADRILAGGAVATAHARGADADYPHVISVYERLAHWAADHDRDLGDAPYEIYHSKPGDPISAQHTEVAWPLKGLRSAVWPSAPGTPGP